MIPLLLLLLPGCADPDPRDSGDPPTDTSPDPDTGDTGVPGDGPQDPPVRVVLVTLDALNRDTLSWRHPSWDPTPHLDALRALSLELPNVTMVRSQTAVSVASLLSGTTPAVHGVRGDWDRWDGQVPLVQEVFQAAGWTTLAFLGNVCQYGETGFDSLLCMEHEAFLSDQQAVDQELVEGFRGAMLGVAADTPVFAWIHLMDAHDPHTPRSTVSTYHPEPYMGFLDPSDPQQMLDVMTGAAPFSEDDLAWVQAVYASEVEGVDAQVGRILDMLQALPTWDRTVVLLGADHGEELFQHQRYAYHDCSFYQDTVATTWLLRAPGHGFAGRAYAPWVGATDLAATLLDLAGLEVSLGGSSRVQDLEVGRDPGLPTFFERSPETAGIVSDGYVLIRNEAPAFSDCEPFWGGAGSYDSPSDVELYDLAMDPVQAVDRSSSDPATVATLEAALCEWVLSQDWGHSVSGDLSEVALASDCAIGAGAGTRTPPGDPPRHRSARQSPPGSRPSPALRRGSSW